MSNDSNLPATAVKSIEEMKNKLDPIIDKLDLKGLSYKQRQFVFCYNGNAIAAADAAGYAKNYSQQAHRTAALSKIVARLMQNEKIQRNIYLIQKQMEAFGVLNVAEAKDIVSEIARTSSSEARRLEAAKLALQWEGALADPVKRYELDVKMQQHNIREFIFQGPKPAFLRDREEKAQQVIDVEPEPDSLNIDDIL